MTVCRTRGRLWAVAIVFGSLACTIAVEAQPPKLTQPTPVAVAAYRRAANLQNSGEFELSADQWEAFIKKFPTTDLTPKATYYAGVCRLQTKELAKAAEHLKLVTTKWSEVPKFRELEDAYLNLGWCQYTLAGEKKSGQAAAYAEAAKTLAELIKKYPTGRATDQALFFQGDALYLQSTALAMAADAADADQAKTLRAESDKAKDASVKSFQQLVTKFPESGMRVTALYNLGVAQEELEQYADAGKTYETFLKEFADNQLSTEVGMRHAETVLQQGIELESTDPQAAKAAFKEAADQFAQAATAPDFAQADHAVIRQAFATARLDDFQAAAELYEKIASKSPKSIYAKEATINAGRFFYQAKDDAKALKWFNAVLKDKGSAAEAPEAAHWMCQIHLRNDEPGKAAALAKKVTPNAAGSEYLVPLMMDEADGLYGDPKTRGDSIPLYAKIADEHPDHKSVPQALYNAAFTAMTIDQFDDALNYANQYLAKYQDSPLTPDVKHVVAECQLQKKDYAKAETLFRELLDESGDHESVSIWKVRLGLTLFLQKKYGEVVAFLKPLVDGLTQPAQTAEALFLVGSSQLEEGKFAEAVGSLAASLKADAKWSKADETLLNLAQAQYKQGKPKSALGTIKELIDGHGDSKLLDQAQYRQGEYEFAVGEFSKATVAYEAVIKNWPDSSMVPYAMYGSGWSKMNLKDYEGAISNFTDLLDKTGDHSLAPDTHYARGMARRQTMDFKGAIADFDAFLKSKVKTDDKVVALYEKGLAQVSLDDNKSAAESFAAALSADASNKLAANCVYELAWAQRSSNQPEEALKNFAKLAKEHPTSEFAAEAHFHLGEDKYSNAEYDAAKQEYTAAKSKAVANEGNELAEKSTYKLGWSNYQLESFDAALKEFQEQVEKYPQGKLHADGLFMVAESNFNLKKFKEALPAYLAAQAAAEKSNKISDDVKALTLLHGGQSAIELSQWDEAFKLLQPIEQEFPKSPLIAQAQFEIGQVLHGQRKYKEAEAAFETASDRATIDGQSGLAARARYMIGEVCFAQKNYKDAVANFKLVRLGFGNDGPEEVKKWQGYAAFEAGQCSYVRISTTTDPEEKAKLIAEAKRHFTDVVENFPGHATAAQAKKQLATLAKIK